MIELEHETENGDLSSQQYEKRARVMQISDGRRMRLLTSLKMAMFLLLLVMVFVDGSFCC